MATVSTGVTGDVREHHFRCIEGHEFSVLARNDAEIKPMLPVCPVDSCYKSADRLADNSAEVSTNPADLLLN